MSTIPAAPATTPGGRERSGGPLGGWRNGVIHQIHVRSVPDSDGDGIGDLGGVRARLPHLRRLWVGGTSLEPFHASPQCDHGHDVFYHLTVHPEFGDPAAFDGVPGRSDREDGETVPANSAAWFVLEEMS